MASFANFLFGRKENKRRVRFCVYLVSRTADNDKQ
jgi:hypothetical protein